MQGVSKDEGKELLEVGVWVDGVEGCFRSRLIR